MNKANELFILDKIEKVTNKKKAKIYKIIKPLRDKFHDNKAP